MTANRTQVGVLAVGLLALLIAIGCSSDGDLISSGNVVVTYPAATTNPSNIDYSCIRMNYTLFAIKPADGVCSESSGEFAGSPCGTAADCTRVDASCDPGFANGCDGGPNHNQDCIVTPENPEPCPDGECVPRGECAVFPGGFFTGQGCLSVLDCTPGSGEECAGTCSAGSANEDGACLNTGDCTLGKCEGAQAADSLGGNPILLINGTAPIYFTPSCPACELENSAIPVLCEPGDEDLRCYDQPGSPECTDDTDCASGVECDPRCRNRCLTTEELGNQDPVITCRSTTDKCCEKFELVAPPCRTDADCEVNQCNESAVPLGSDNLSEGTYLITDLTMTKLRMFAPDTLNYFVSCGDASGSVRLQYDPPLTFDVGPGRSNRVTSVVDITTLENLLGIPTVGIIDCDAAFSDLPAWFTVVSD